MNFHIYSAKQTSSGCKFATNLISVLLMGAGTEDFNDTNDPLEYLMQFLIPIYRHLLIIFLCCTTILHVFRLRTQNLVLQQLHRPDMLPAQQH